MHSLPLAAVPTTRNRPVANSVGEGQHLFYLKRIEWESRHGFALSCNTEDHRIFIRSGAPEWICRMWSCSAGSAQEP